MKGIDVEDVNIVVNFDLPLDSQNNPDYETYLHRIGRTGRFGKPGIAINLIDPSEISILDRIQKRFGREIKPIDASNPEDIQKLNDNNNNRIQ